MLPPKSGTPSTPPTPHSGLKLKEPIGLLQPSLMRAAVSLKQPSLLLSHPHCPCCMSHPDPRQTPKSFLTLNLHFPWLLDLFAKPQNSASSHHAQKLRMFPTAFRRKPKRTGPSQSDLVSFLLHLLSCVPRASTLTSSMSFSLLLPPHVSGGHCGLQATSRMAHISPCLDALLPPLCLSNGPASSKAQIKCHLC